MTANVREVSPKLLARMAGLFFLLTISGGNLCAGLRQRKVDCIQRRERDGDKHPLAQGTVPTWTHYLSHRDGLPDRDDHSLLRASPAGEQES